MKNGDCGWITASIVVVVLTSCVYNSPGMRKRGIYNYAYISSLLRRRR